MINLEPFNQTKLFGLNNYIQNLIYLDKKKVLPNKILLSGQKGLGKSTLAYHFINYSLSKNEKFPYNQEDFFINDKNHSYKTILNKSNLNFHLIDIDLEKKSIDLDQIRKLITSLNKSSFNNKPRFVLIDNIEFLNVNSINALLKILEEPTLDVYFILINNNKRILQTLTSRCLNFKISLTNQQCLSISEKLLTKKIDDVINKDLISYYSTPGNIYKLIKFANENDYNLVNLKLEEFISILIKNSYYKKNNTTKLFIYDLIELYLSKLNFISKNLHDKYSYFLDKIANTKKFNLDDEALFIEFQEKILNG